MKEPKDKVLEMIQKGKISPEEGDILLDAMKEKPRIFPKILFDPFSHITEPFALIAAGLFAVAAAAVSTNMNIRFDGFLDFHMASEDTGWTVALLDQVVAWPLSALILWAVAFGIGKQGRLVDFISAVGLARGIQLLGGMLAALVAPSKEVAKSLTEKALQGSTDFSGELIAHLPIIICGMVSIAWFITVLVFATKHASGQKGGKLALCTVLGIIAAEIVSKIALAIL